MDIITVLLAIVVLGGAGIAWIREQRTWTRFREAPARQSADVTRLYQALLSADVRVRYKVTSFAGSMSGHGIGRDQTAIVLVHRDDLSRAREVQAGLGGDDVS